MSTTSPFTTVERAIEEIRSGRMVVVCDSEDRENEGDLIMAAQFATPEAVNFMAKYGRGLICMPMLGERLDELQMRLAGTMRREARTRRERLLRVAADGSHTEIVANGFQAWRIDESRDLDLTELLRALPGALKPGGRVAVISFHSGEDRLVKQSFRDGLRTGVYAAVSDEAIRASYDERQTNPRSRSAKLRWAFSRDAESAERLTVTPSSPPSAGLAPPPN